ncbi:hypothetical protein FB451DRAFT_1415471 [Mycena latifolia]|nr:hypothetical protein FB451DRAFT_1415471 [Mycena latifolia]
MTVFTVWMTFTFSLLQATSIIVTVTRPRRWRRDGRAVTVTVASLQGHTVRMASGQVILSEVSWEGVVEAGGVHTGGAFEVFDSGGGWSFLFGKPLQTAFGAVHDYGQDTITLTVGGTRVTLRNQRGDPWWKKLKLAETAGVPEAFTGVISFAETPARRVHFTKSITYGSFDKHQETGPPRVNVTYKEEREELAETTHIEEMTAEADRRRPTVEEVEDEDVPPSKLRVEVHMSLEEILSMGASATPARGVPADTPIHLVESTTDPALVSAGQEELYDTDAYMTSPADLIFTRAMDPFNPKRVQAIVEAVRLGPDLTETQRAEVRQLIAEFTDTFALADRKFSTKVQQRPLTRPQAEYIHEQVDMLERAGIIRPIHPRDVKCVSPIKLAEKEHDGGGMTHDELKHALNDECIRAGLPRIYDLPLRDSAEPDTQPRKAPKWRICQNFHELNELLKVVPFPQGDIR